MTTIAIDPEHLETVSTQFEAGAHELRSLEDRLARAEASLDWALRGRSLFEGDTAAARRQMNALASQAQQFRNLLSAIARAFADADRTGADRLVQSVGIPREGLQSDLRGAKEAWWQAHLRGDEAGMAQARARADYDRSLGAQDSDGLNAELRARYEPVAQLEQAKLDWWMAWAKGDQPDMAKAHARAEALRAAGTPELGGAENLHVLNQALAAVMADQRRAELRGQADRVAALGAKADHLREQGATLTAEKKHEIAAMNSAQDRGEESPATAAPAAAPEHRPQFDGTVPAPGTTDYKHVWLPTTPTITSSAANRSRALYDDVLNQFAVGNNRRYSPRDDNTFCNIFVWDATEAMGAPIPHWVDRASGAPVSAEVLRDSAKFAAVAGRSYELDANGVCHWLDEHGPEHGWHLAPPLEAQKLANQGKPAVVVYDSHSGDAGHVAMVRPGPADFAPDAGPTIAQAGAKNFNTGTVLRGFGEVSKAVRYYVHD